MLKKRPSLNVRSHFSGIYVYRLVSELESQSKPMTAQRHPGQDKQWIKLWTLIVKHVIIPLTWLYSLHSLTTKFSATHLICNVCKISWEMECTLVVSVTLNIMFPFIKLSDITYLAEHLQRLWVWLKPPRALPRGSPQ